MSLHLYKGNICIRYWILSIGRSTILPSVVFTFENAHVQSKALKSALKIHQSVGINVVHYNPDTTSLYWVSYMAPFFNSIHPYILIKYSRTCLKLPLKNRQNKGLKDKWKLNEGRKYCRMLPLEHYFRPALSVNWS